jgi:ElaB/YqjD/DUF883 family membrane-anchored ribosome-binding protein
MKKQDTQESEVKSVASSQDALLVELQALIGDAEKLLQHAADLAGDQADELRKHIQLNLQRARETLGNGEDAIRQGAEEMQRAGETYVKNNPLQALGIAAGVGLLIGLLLGHRKHDR